NDTTPPPNKLLPKTRHARPSPRTSHLRNFIPHAPFIVPSGYLNTSGTARERSFPRTPVLHRRRAYRPAAQTNASQNSQFPLTPEKLRPPYDAVHWAAR